MAQLIEDSPSDALHRRLCLLGRVLPALVAADQPKQSRRAPLRFIGACVADYLADVGFAAAETRRNVKESAYQGAGKE
jgi:hypothetical protein